MIRTMAARLNPSHDLRTREKIKTSQLINLLQDNALKGTGLDAIRQRSAEILLRKSLPDLSQTEIMGTVATYVARLPTPAPTAAAWLESVDTPQLVSPLPATHEQPIDSAKVIDVGVSDYKPDVPQEHEGE
jgi:hypothetical protein